MKIQQKNVQRSAERCKGVHRVDLGESFPTSIYLQNFAKFGFGERANKLGRLHHLVVDFSLKF